MRKIFFWLATLTIYSPVFSQTHDSIPRIIFGFDLGLNYSNASIKDVNPDVMISNSLGFRMGLLMDCKLNRRLSFIPKLNYRLTDPK